MFFSFPIYAVVFVLQAIDAAPEEAQVITLGYISWEESTPGYTIPGATLNGYTINGATLGGAQIPGATLPGWTHTLTYTNIKETSFPSSEALHAENDMGQGVSDQNAPYAVETLSSFLTYVSEFPGSTIPGLTKTGLTTSQEIYSGMSIPQDVNPGFTETATVSQLNVLSAQDTGESVDTSEEAIPESSPTAAPESTTEAAIGVPEYTQVSSVSMNTAHASPCHEGMTCKVLPVSTSIASDEVKVYTYMA